MCSRRCVNHSCGARRATTSSCRIWRPKCSRDGPPDARTDLFTLGVVAYQLVTGRLPYRAPSLPALIGQMLTTMPTALTPDEAPAAAGAAILRCLSAASDARGTLADMQTSTRPL